ncbi:MAG: FtsQ-type POTRA domain-containing protein [Deltaproteobacteria bacterium]|nr:FtsQ-type POTRA domain-containing protein [Deltaproteobacteria bacterium]
MRLRPQVRRLKAGLATGSRVVAVAATVTLAAGAVSWAAWVHVIPFVTGHEYFRLRSIRVACDNPEVPPGSLAQLGDLYDDSSLWQIDPPAVEQRLGEQSWVRSAQVSRSFPWKVSIDVARRHAVAATVSQGKVYLVDADGVLFQEIQPEHAPDLVYLTGWDEASPQAERASRLRALLAVLAEAGRRSYRVSELHMDAGAIVWMFPTDMRASVRIGPASRAAAAFDRLGVALVQLAPVVDQLRSIDVDYNDRVVVRGADDKFPTLVSARLDRPTEHPASAPAAAPPSEEAKRSNG